MWEMLIPTSWPLNGNKVPMGRAQPTHDVKKLSEVGLAKGHGWDDELTFNTQVSVREHPQVRM